MFLFFYVFQHFVKQIHKHRSTKSPWPTITGSLDAYYRYNFANAKDPTTGNPVTNNYTSFTNSQNSFELGMASIQAAHSFGKASAFVDLGFGRRAEEFYYPGDGASGEVVILLFFGFRKTGFFELCHNR